PNRPFKKSATVVGDVLGRYHPHGDSAVYDALVRMVQDFSLRYPLIQGQGNFGSVDGDSAAAYRYTEARLAQIATEMLGDIDKETVDFAPNFDDRLLEPTVLPAKVPNLLVNGSSGIAVGMSTNVPPHNLREVVHAAIHLLDHPECSVADLMRFIPGPDFPTGGIIVGREGIRQAYEKGRGRVVMRARVTREQRRGGREQLVVTEIPYATNKTRIVEQIADLVKREKIPDISDLRDESDREGIRIVIELKRGANVMKVLGALFKWTALQSTFGVITLALDKGVPREFTLKELLERFRDHRIEVVVRRSRWELEKARDEVHVLEGLLVALKHIEEVVRLIRGSRNRETAGRKLQKQFDLSERQAEAILNMRLVRLTALEAKELRERRSALELRIRELEAILGSPARQIAVVRRELEEILEAYGDVRRTTIVSEEAGMPLEKRLAAEEVVITVSYEGFIKQIPMGLYRRRVGAGKVIAGMERYENDYLEHVFVATTRDVLMFFTDDGRVSWLPVAEVPEGSRASRGRSLHQMLGLPRGTHITSLLPLPSDGKEAMLLFATAEGLVKRTPLEQFSSPRAGGVIAITLKEGDRLVEALLTDGTADVVLITRKGRVIRFPEEEVSPTGRATQGVKGVKVGSADGVAGMLAVRRDAALCMLTERGLAKCTPLSDFPLQGRGGLGAVAMPVGAKSGAVLAALELLEEEELMVVTSAGRTLRLAGEQIPVLDRGAPGEAVLELEEGEKLIDVTRVATRQESSPSADLRPDAATEDSEEADEAENAELTDEEQLELLGAAGE
ncbi:MAG: DNA gyrase subunit A, partial [Gemmatimonadota bacterium]|nr:DNA gyrase subunit A [Gemmatimonadota bacterium]